MFGSQSISSMEWEKVPIHFTQLHFNEIEWKCQSYAQIPIQSWLTELSSINNLDSFLSERFGLRLRFVLAHETNESAIVVVLVPYLRVHNKKVQLKMWCFWKLFANENECSVPGVRNKYQTFAIYLQRCVCGQQIFVNTANVNMVRMKWMRMNGKCHYYKFNNKISIQIKR